MVEVVWHTEFCIYFEGRAIEFSGYMKERGVGEDSEGFWPEQLEDNFTINWYMGQEFEYSILGVDQKLIFSCFNWDVF